MNNSNPSNLNELKEHRKMLIVLIADAKRQFGSASEINTLKCGLKHLDEMIKEIDVDRMLPAPNEHETDFDNSPGQT